MQLLSSVLLSTLITAQVLAAPPPWKSWTFCKEVDPSKTNTCLIKAIKATEKDLIHGNSYFGTPSLDPLHIDKLAMKQAGANKPIAVDIIFKNVVIKGLHQWQLVDVKSDLHNGKNYAKIKIKGLVTMDSDYNVSGKVLVLPITGQGKSRIVFEDMTVIMRFQNTIVERKNKRYVNVESFQVELDPKSMTINFENLFNGNKALGDNMNKVLNENWKEIIKDVGKPLTQGLAEAFKQISLRVFAKIPYDDVMPK